MSTEIPIWNLELQLNRAYDYETNLWSVNHVCIDTLTLITKPNNRYLQCSTGAWRMRYPGEPLLQRWQACVSEYIYCLFWSRQNVTLHLYLDKI